jgi:hypothetical protein
MPHKLLALHLFNIGCGVGHKWHDSKAVFSESQASKIKNERLALIV